jgi:hypothetical protein
MGIEPDRQPEDGDYGDEVEEDVRQIVPQLGVAEFVYTVPVIAQAAGTTAPHPLGGTGSFSWGKNVEEGFSGWTGRTA